MSARPDPVALRKHEALTRTLADAIARSGVERGEGFPCPYIEGREARHVTLAPRPFSAAVYHGLMDLNFRRLGDVVYRPDCEGCRECRMIRLPVAAFRPTRGQRRALARNRDVVVSVGAPEPTAEKLDVYRRYLAARHDGGMDGSAAEFEGFLYSSPLDSVEVEYRVGTMLLGVGIVDVTPLALSAVYFYFDPALSARSPGVYNVLWLVGEARRRGLPWLYLGYYVAPARSMRYKAAYAPCEVLGQDGGFAPASDAQVEPGP